MTRKRSLMIVEDDLDTVQLLETYFSGHGYEVHTAKRGSEALLDTRRLTPDLVLLDVILPEMDGLTICRELRASPRTSHIPIILLTEKATQSDRVAGLTAGAQDYITKPFDLEELRLRIHNLISRSERENLLDPRSGLPTGRQVDEQLRRREGQSDWKVITCRIDSFQPFVDVNGFAAGDNVLKMAAHLLREIVNEQGSADDFIGHPANDTFLILTSAAQADTLGGQVQARFNAEVLAHYSFMDREQGYILIRDQRGGSEDMLRVPLMTLQLDARAA